MSSFLRAASVALLLGLPLAACEDEGPAERAGERVDRAGEQLGESLERAGENLRDAVDPPRGPLERAGRNVERAVD